MYRYVIMLKRLLAILICILFANNTWGKTPLKVAVFPFTVNSNEQLDYLQEGIADMLVTRMEQDQDISTIDTLTMKELLQGMPGRIDERQAREIAAQAGADCAVMGSFTKIGSAASIDARILYISQDKEDEHVFVECTSLDSVHSQIGVLARQLDLSMLDKSLVAEIDVTGNRYIEKDAIKFVIKTKEGDIFSLQALQEDLRQVYQMGYFTDVQIDSKDSPQGKRLTFIVVERPVVSQIKIQGNKNIKTPDIQKKLGMQLGRVLDQNQVRKDVESIRKMYLDKGYLSAEVDFKLIPAGEGETSVDFYIRENDIAKVKKITFLGNEHLKSKKLKRVMETKEKNFLSFITSAGIFKEESFQKDLENLRAYYYHEGYIKAKVGIPTVTHEEKDIYITIPVEEGFQYTIGAVDIKGDLIIPREVLAEGLQTVEGKVFSSSYLNKDMVAMTDLYSDRGYANVDITPLTSIDDEAKTISVEFDVVKGEKVYFDRINITGNDRTRDKVIRRELKVVEGDLYSTSAVKRSQEKIENLGYFKKSNLTTSKGAEPNTMTLNVEVEEKPTGSISFGAGYSSVDSLVGMITLAQENFLGKGQHINISAQLGGVNRFMFSFTEPWFRDTRWSAGFDLYNMERWYEDFDSESMGGNIRFGHPIGEYTRINFGYEYENVDISNVDEDASLEIQESEGETTIGALTGGISRSTLDNRFTPRRGSLCSFTTKLAGVGGDADFLTLIASAAKYFPLPWDSAFMIRGTIGYSEGLGGDDVPIFEKFFLGGLDSLRGFEERSVGPREQRRSYDPFIPDPDDYDVVGGEKQLFFNFEYIFPILKEAGIRGVLFFDTGNAYRSSESYFSDMRKSAGFGVRWQSPFGPLRLEMGFNLDRESKYDESSSEFHFTMGSMF